MKSDTMNNKLQINRRQFLAAVGAAGVSMFAFGNTATSSASAAKWQSGGALSLAAFRLVAGTRFVISTAEGTVGATLAQVTEDQKCASLEQFTATFKLEGKADLPLTSDVYELRHPELGNISLLLTPSETPKLMTATFCQLAG